MLSKFIEEHSLYLQSQNSTHIAECVFEGRFQAKEGGGNFGGGRELGIA